MAVPSQVEVPRPTSSMQMSDRDVARRTSWAVSRISRWNVDSPARASSQAPTRAITRSRTVSLAPASAGTNDPTCASTAATAAARTSVDLPPMFGPERRSMSAADPPTVTSLQMTSPPNASRHGCAPPRISMKDSAPSTTRARQKPSRLETWARASSASSAATQATAAAHRAREASNAAKSDRSWSSFAPPTRRSAASSSRSKSCASQASKDREALVFFFCSHSCGTLARPKNDSGTLTR
mmetsp:Transcript_26384/g.88712  ORF Transcript_26384/g.88712 Transcript_26384/m.88712 type:complete len:240 (-) Transcript_26384:1044-1763(-)